MKADIFFVITSLAVILLTSLLIVLLFYLLKIARIAREIMDIAKYQVHEMSRDADDIRKKVRQQSGFLDAFRVIFSNIWKGGKGRNKRK